MPYDVPTHLKTVEMLKAAIAAKHEKVVVPDLHSAARFAFTALDNFHSYVIRDIDPSKPEPGKVYMLVTVNIGTEIHKVKVYQQWNGPTNFGHTAAPHFTNDPITPLEKASLAPVEPVATQHTFDITPNITVDQAKRMEDALNQRHAAGEELVRQFRDLLATGVIGKMQDPRFNEATQELRDMRDTLKEWDEHNKVFTDAVFERKPKQVLVPGKGGEWPGTVHTIKSQEIPSTPSHYIHVQGSDGSGVDVPVGGG